MADASCALVGYVHARQPVPPARRIRRRAHPPHCPAARRADQPDRRRRGHRAPCLRHQGAAGERAGCRGQPDRDPHRGRRPAPAPGHRQRPGHRERPAAAGLGPARHQQDCLAGRPGTRHLAGLPGRGPGLDGRRLAPDPGQPPAGRRTRLESGRAARPGRSAARTRRHCPRYRHRGHRPVLGHPGAAQVPEVAGHRGRLLPGRHPAHCPVAPGRAVRRPSGRP